jgi:hypothetical protein
MYNTKSFVKRLSIMSDEYLIKLYKQHSCLGHVKLKPYERENVDITLSLIKDELDKRKLKYK